MKLYTSPGACSTADHIVLEWIGKPFEFETVSREQRAAPEFRKLNPAGAVPVLEDQGYVLTQNMAILHYLVDKHPEAKLDGDGTPKGRAEVNRWLAFVNADVHPSFKPLFGATAYLEDPAMIEKSKAQARSTLRGYYERANNQLKGRDWIAGSRSIADPYLFITTRWAKATGGDLGGFDHLEAHYARMQADPGVQKAFKAEGLS
ncbi:MAG: glutathione S-transferase N-terminal domain-containing protein [Dokdonella sp.]|uniref:glutathione S-transferase family protein n=1 Tax=Dokdonella sp. TaxID=2291710 RepID=UPI0025C3A095|nr:glutathione S-transferase N-terminal domain-containing protein [Dokdonella sp.]MBZ0221796.1 glutathione S-transferase N-terminal domain-containing protein [Dokdonella sp.]